MQSRFLQKIGRARAWPQHPIYGDLQHARSYVPSSHHQVSKSWAQPKSLGSPPPHPPRGTPDALEFSRARRTDGSDIHRSNSRWYEWATRHKFLVGTFFILGSGSFLIHCFCSKRVPITGRWQLDLVPHWKAVQMAKSKREQEDQIRPELMEHSIGRGHPQMQACTEMFDRLVRSSGLENRDWEFRLARDPRE